MEIEIEMKAKESSTQKATCLPWISPGIRNATAAITMKITIASHKKILDKRSFIILIFVRHSFIYDM